jgi:hypothetical protein
MILHIVVLLVYTYVQARESILLNLHKLEFLFLTPQKLSKDEHNLEAVVEAYAQVAETDD